ncbi:MAG: hypothetical protein OEU50_00675 [Gammaproteobacteria bacterium]|nr:hypothetical protein [Gammaproteobacteria bacterium]
MDDSTRNALRSARMQALDGPARSRIPRWIPATSFACLLLIMVGFLLNRSEDPSELPQMTAEELALIASEDELELLEELEFYIWFDEDKNV